VFWVPDASQVGAIPNIANAITSTHISQNAIQSPHISANAITTNHLAAGAVTANMITAGTMSADRIQGGTIHGANISGSMSGSFQNLDCNHLIAAAAVFNINRPTFLGVGLATLNDVGGSSDVRDKADIQELPYDALDFINQLHPVQFRYKFRDSTATTASAQISTTAGYDKVGFIAQEVETIADALGFDFTGLSFDKESDMYLLQLDQFIAPMVRAIQQLSQRVGKLEKRTESRGNR